MTTISLGMNAQFAALVRNAGLDALDWVLRCAQQTDPTSPEHGGIRGVYDAMRREFRQSTHGLCLTWSASLAAFAGLAAYDLTGDPFYMDRVLLISKYVKSNQNLDASDPLRYGTFVVSRDRQFVDVPDASWAGNLFVHLYRRTGEAEYLERAKLTANWLLRQGRMVHGGFATFYLLEKEQPVAYSHASDGQHGIFLSSLYEETGEERYLEPLKPLADMLSGPGQHESGPYYVSLRADGTPVVEGWDKEAGHPLVEGIERATTGPRQNYYAALFLLDQYGRDGNPRYLESARRCAEWTVNRYHHDGYISDFFTLNGDGDWEPDGLADVASAGAMMRVWLRLHQVEADPRWADACCEQSEWCVRWQRHESRCPDVHGAIFVQPYVISYFVSFAVWGLLEFAGYLASQAGQHPVCDQPVLGAWHEVS